jgi:hypothetical protein
MHAVGLHQIYTSDSIKLVLLWAFADGRARLQVSVDLWHFISRTSHMSVIRQATRIIRRHKTSYIWPRVCCHRVITIHIVVWRYKQTRLCRNYRNPVNQANSTQLKQGSGSIIDTSVLHTGRSDEQQQSFNYFNESSRLLASIQRRH